MRKISEIQLQGLIFHILEHKSITGLVLSEDEVSLTDTQPLVEYISKHICNSLQDEATKAAKFSVSESETEPDQEIANICQKLIDDRDYLVNGSQQIARRLYEIIKDDNRISSGGLAVCLFQDIDDQDQTYLALLKLDAASVFRFKLNQKAGRKVVGVEVLNNALPTARERLQKCAFIRSQNSDSEYDLMLLDRQTKEEEGIARFFAEDFLEVKLAFDPKTNTRRLRRSLIEAHNNLRSDLTAEEDHILRQARNNALYSEFIDVDLFVSSLSLPENYKEVIKNTIYKYLPERKIKIDPEVGKKLSQKKRFKGDRGFRLEVNNVDYERVVKSIEEVKGNNNETLYTKMILHVNSLEESS